MLSLTPLWRRILIRSSIIIVAILLLVGAGVIGFIYYYGPKMGQAGGSRSSSRSYSLDLLTGPLADMMPKGADNGADNGAEGGSSGLRDYPKTDLHDDGFNSSALPRGARDAEEIVNAPLGKKSNLDQGGRTVPSYLIDRAPLPPAPDSGVTKQTEMGQLPVIGIDGRKPWMVYAKPFSLPPRPSSLANGKASQPPVLVGVVVGFIGSSSEVSESAIAQLPGNVTLAIDPYDERAEWWLAKARANGHETLMGLPLEPQDFPKSDAGAAALLTSLSEADNSLRLEWLLSRGLGYVGVINVSGEKFLSQPRVTIPLLKNLNSRGLLMVANGYDQSSTAAADGMVTSTKIRRVGRLARDIGVPRAMVDLRITGGMTENDVRQRLMAAERIAEINGQTVVMVERPTLAILGLVSEWLIGFDEAKMRLAPISALVDRQADKPVVTLESMKKSLNVR
ncbi:MAG: divergent polysaccharide deacetylase family protein [Candidatus Pacebacteria bacterium]|nr:divergent polysaccharide deacetylase family protein [Candidatus Paceibacterota bacterium]